MGSAASFSNWDLAENPLGPSRKIASFTADLPDWFYRIMLLEALRPYFVFGEFTLDEFIFYMAEHGTHIEKPEGHRHLCLAVLPMGWSWAPFVAHTLMLDVFEHAITPWRSLRVEDGRPTPHPGDGRPVHWGYMDDFGALTVLPENKPLETAPVARMKHAAISAFTELGVVPHKLTLGEGLDRTLGVEIGRDRVLRIVPEKWWLLLAATEWAAEQPALSMRALSRLIGIWAWRFTIFRELFSILSEVYSFLAEKPLDAFCPLWPSVRQELRALVALAPICACPLDLAWSSTVLMTDASEEGYGVVGTLADPDEIALEARFSEKRGWVTKADAAYTMCELEAEDDEDIAVQRGASPPQDLFSATLFARSHRVVLHLFSGRRRAFDFEHYIEQFGQTDSHFLVAVSVDVQVDAATGDMTDPRAIEFWETSMKRGYVAGMHGGPPCSTWSKARFNQRFAGPRPLRSVEEPWGLPGLKPHEQQAVDLGNALLRATMRLARAILKCEGYFSIEHPADGGAGYPSIWKLPEMRTLEQAPGVRLITLHQCRFELNAVKPTNIMSNLPGIVELALRCNHPRGTHQVLQGTDENGRFRTSIAQEYPPALCRALAGVYVQAIRADSPAGFDELAEPPPPRPGEQETVRRRAPRRERAPPPEPTWNDVARWRTMFAGRWRDEEHINVLEMRSLIAAARHLSRSRKNWDHKFLIFTDSMVCLGALGKGRSSSPRLLRMCRRWVLFRAVFGMRFFLRHVPTHLNMADGPSRGTKIHISEPKAKDTKRKSSATGVLRYRGQG